MHVKTKMLLAVVMVVSLGMVGCSPPQASPKNLQLISSLRTALSAQNAQWLEQNAKIIEERREAGEVGDEEYETFQAIIAKAKAGQWEEAEKDALAFQKAQHPTQDQVERLRQ